MKALIALVCIVSVLQLASSQWQPFFLGETRLQNAAYIEAFQSEDDSLPYENRWSLYISTFNSLLLGINDEVFFMAAPGLYLDSVANWSDSNIINYDKSAVWPNDINYMPSSVVGTEGIVQTSGFHVTTKMNGQLQLYSTSGPIPVLMANIAEGDSNEWSYHRVHWQDMDLDGDLDAVTARFHQPTIGKTLMEFLWFENPNSTVAMPAWTERVLNTTGPDMNFVTTTLTANGTNYQVFLISEFFAERISVYWTENPNNDWSDQASIMSRIINPASGQSFDLLVDDFNRDGVKEFVATEYNPLTFTGHVKVYFFPPDFRTDDFTSLIIADGFVPSSLIGGQVSPGTPKTYYPSTYYANELAPDGLPHKPWMLVSGDDDGRMYVLYPINDIRDDWTYQKHILVDTLGGQCGKMTTADLDGDGYQEIIVAGFGANRLYVYTYNPFAKSKN